MQHTWGSEINFGYVWERPTTADGTNDTPAPDRPTQGTVILAQDPAGNDLGQTTTEPGGYWLFQADVDAPTAQAVFSADGGTTWTPSLASYETQQNGISAAANAATALTTATAAQSTAQEALSLAVSGGAKSVNGKTPDSNGNIQLVASDVGALSTGGTLPAAQVSGLATVAKTGSFNDLADRPPIAIPMSQKGIASGVAALDAAGNVLNGSGAIVGSGGSGSGVPAGGTAGQMLVKNTSTNGDVSWETVTASMVDARDASVQVPASDVSGLSTIATSGALSDASGSGTVAQLPAGSVVAVHYSGSAWPARPTTRTNITCHYYAAAASNPAPADYVSGVDFLFKPAS